MNSAGAAGSPQLRTWQRRPRTSTKRDWLGFSGLSFGSDAQQSDTSLPELRRPFHVRLDSGSTLGRGDFKCRTNDISLHHRSTSSGARSSSGRCRDSELDMNGQNVRLKEMIGHSMWFGDLTPEERARVEAETVERFV